MREKELNNKLTSDEQEKLVFDFKEASCERSKVVAVYKALAFVFTGKERISEWIWVYNSLGSVRHIMIGDPTQLTTTASPIETLEIGV